jgi:very-short-patch-repair endonuclease
MRRAIADLALHYREIGSYGPRHPWFGFFPDRLNPGDNLRLRRFLADLIDDIRRFDQAIAVLRQRAFAQIPNSLAELKAFARVVQVLEESGPRVITELLPRLFPPHDPMAQTAEALVQQLEGRCDEARHLAQITENALRNPDAITEATLGEVQSALTIFQRYGIADRSLASLEQVVTDLRQAVSPIKEALEFFRKTAVLASLTFDETDESIRCTYGIVAIAHELPQELHALRHPGLNHPTTRTMLSAAQEQRSNLRQQRETLECLFWLDDQPGETELLQAIRILRQGDRWYRIFQRKWRWAVRLHKTFSRDTKGKKSAANRLEELTKLARHRKAVEQFERSQEYAEAFGVLFRGMDSDFGKIEQLVSWYEKGRTTLLRHGLRQEALDLTTFESSRLCQLALRMESAQAHLRAMEEARECIDRALRDTAIHDTAVNTHQPWTERLATIETFLNEVQTALTTLTPVGSSTLTPEDVLRAVVARQRCTLLLRQIEDQPDVQNLLGDHFRGLSTDFPSIFETIVWGRKVRCANLPDDTKNALLTDEAGERLASLKQAAASAYEAARFDQRFGDKMCQYGYFNWEQWSSAGPPADNQIPTEAVQARAKLALDHMDGLLSWAQYNRARREVANFGLKIFAEHLEAGAINSDSLEDAFLYRFYASIAESLFGSRYELGHFSGMSHEEVRKEFSELDKEVISLRGKACAANIARQASPPPGVSGVRVEERTEMALLNHLMTLQRPRTPIRQMICRAGRTIQELKPCFMMSPLSVAQYLEPGKVEFDLVVMDEASQLKIEEALGAIARGKQLVVVGDQKQLPPTSFFDRMMTTTDDELDEGTAVTTSESILDICSPLFLNRTLRWHYRSKHESLIAFSNHHFYNGQLIVFPSPHPKSNRLGICFHYISDGVYQSRQNFPEAQRVVDAVLAHMQSRPDESLGVVTLNITQRDLIEEILTERLKNHEGGESYKARWEKEGWPFFVKNLENVQGDERDVIFISTTFGRAPGTTVVRQNFGPISRPTGWRRLNVLFTRARRSLHIFSSMRPEDIVIDEHTPEGTRTLKNYLEYAARGVLVGPDIPGREPDSDFEVVVADVLKSRGYEVQPQLGVAGYFIDLAVRNPDRPGEFLAAIECDGATYHSGTSLRDRDRIRQEILESLGWKGRIWRIWSPDWFRNPQAEATRLLAFLEERRKAAAQEPAPPIVETEVVEEIDSAVVREGAPKELALPSVDEDEELYVEVGDTVTYCDVEAPTERKQVLITEGPSNFEQGIINVATPLARTLLDKAEGEEVDLILPGRGPRRFRVLKIDRNTGRRPV